MCLIAVILLIVIHYVQEVDLETMVLYSIVIVTGLIVVSADNLVIIYLGLEAQTFALFILITMDKHSIKSAEAGIKYFILGSLSSGTFLLGMALMFTANVALDLNALIPLGTHNSLHLKVAHSLIILALLFKLSIFPLHF